MTKKDYIKFVNIYEKSLKFIGGEDEKFSYLDRHDFYQELCYVLMEDNPNFNEQIFRDAIQKVYSKKETEHRQLLI